MPRGLSRTLWATVRAGMTAPPLDPQFRQRRSYDVIIGVPKEIKVHEYRVGIVPAGVRELASRGHKVRIQQGAGVGSGIADDRFREAGAEIVPTADDVWSGSEMIMKVKEPIAAEYKRIQPKQTLFTYFHLAAVPEL